MTSEVSRSGRPPAGSGARWVPLILLLVSLPYLSVTAADGLHEASSLLPPKTAAATMRVPEGFRVSLFAGEPDVMQPIGFCLDDRGRLWVAEAYNYPVHGDRPGDRIVIFEDEDGDGSFDRRTVFYDKLNYVTGIEVGFGGAWVMSPPNFYFIPDRDGDDVPDQEPTVLLDGFGNHANAHNLANGFAWGPDGWLYGTHGRTNWSMIGKPGALETDRKRFDGGVYRYHPTKHIWEPYCDGTTNPWGIDWNDVGDAFVCNCVNPHLFQVIQGAHYEPWRGRKSSEHAYQRVDTIADHLHFVGLGNVRNGLGSEDEDEAGGGHAHCGTMIYLGDQFPPEYRNQLFTNNIHGRRINNDLLRKSRSGYVASHGPDLMRSEDPWYMGVTLAYGPSGEVYASDWSDTGECHSTRNTRKQTGRLYRITYLETETAPVDLRSDSDLELVERQWHANDWHVRHARRLLQERAAAGSDLSTAHELLRQRLKGMDRVEWRLRALWALHVSGGLGRDVLTQLLHDEDEEIRRWAVTLLCESPADPSELGQRLAKLAANESSPRVRLALSSALQRLPLSDRWELAAELLDRVEDTKDQNLPLMNWYGTEPLIDEDLRRFSRLIVESKLARIRINGARRIAASDRSAEGTERLLAEWLSARDSNSPAGDQAASDLLEGMLLGLEGKREVALPASWREAYARFVTIDSEELHERAVRLALKFRDRDAIDSLADLAMDRTAKPAERRRAIEALSDSRQKDWGRQLLRLVSDPQARAAAIRGLANFQVAGTPDTLVGVYNELLAVEKQLAIATLVTRPQWATRLLDGIESGSIPVNDLTAYHARQMRSLGNDTITGRLRSLWGEVRATDGERSKQIEKIRRWLKPELIASGDAVNGRAVFAKHCGNCHRFFGEGGKVGPDLTGAQRTNIAYMLENIVDPSASVANDYRMQMVTTDDGRLVTGLLESDGEQSITLLTATDRIVIPKAEVSGRKEAPVSIMPNGLLDPMSEHEIRDLFAYLQRPK